MLTEGGNTPGTFGAPLINRARGLYHPAKLGHLLDIDYDPHTPPPSATIPPYISRQLAGEQITPFLLCHSVDDDVVPVARGDQAWRIINNMGLPVFYRENMVGTTHPKHWISSPRCVDDMGKFIEKSLHSCEHYYGRKRLMVNEEGRVVSAPGNGGSSAAEARVEDPVDEEAGPSGQGQQNTEEEGSVEGS